MTLESIRAFMARKIFLPVLYTYWKTPAFSQYNELMSHETWSAEQIKSLQDRKLAEILQYAFLHIPYYHQVLKAKGIELSDLQNAEAISYFPVLTKKIIQDRHDELVDPGIPRKDYVIEHSGGSTGQPTVVRRDIRARAATHAATWRCNHWIGWEIGEPWMWLWGRLSTTKASGLTKLVNLYKTYVGQEVFFNVHGLDKEKLLGFARQMQSFKPKVIVGYTNAFYQLCLLAKRENIRLPSPSGIATTSETLFAEERRLIEEVLGCRVFNRYASSEVGVIAAECSAHKGLHLMMENVYTECVSEDGSPVPPGVVGKILVTELNNRAMPLIRYDLGDGGVMASSPCLCGRPYPCLEKITGRISDAIRLPDKVVFAEDLGEIFYPLSDSVEKFQVVQEELTKIEIFLVFRPDKETDEIKNLIYRQMREGIGDGVDITIQVVKDIPILASGKHRICISKVSSL
jgi:phenylacetate-CoA ligase